MLISAFIQIDLLAALSTLSFSPLPNGVGVIGTDGTGHFSGISEPFHHGFLEQ